MNNNPSEKKKYVFNFIDVILIILILAAASALVYFLRERKIVISDKGETTEIIYKLEVSPMREEFRNLVEIGDTVTDCTYLLSIGEITDVAYSPCIYTGFNKELGETVKSTYPGKITMTVTIKAEARITDTGYTVNGKELILDEMISFRVPGYTGNGKCVSITVSDNGNQ